MKVRHLISLLLTLLLPLMAAGQEVPDTGQQIPAAGAGDRCAFRRRLSPRHPPLSRRGSPGEVLRRG